MSMEEKVKDWKIVGSNPNCNVSNCARPKKVPILYHKFLYQSGQMDLKS